MFLLHAEEISQRYIGRKCKETEPKKNCDQMGESKTGSSVFKFTLFMHVSLSTAALLPSSHVCMFLLQDNLIKKGK